MRVSDLPEGKGIRPNDHLLDAEIPVHHPEQPRETIRGFEVGHPEVTELYKGGPVDPARPHRDRIATVSPAGVKFRPSGAFSAIPDDDDRDAVFKAWERAREAEMGNLYADEAGE